jgi:hypothetical protein
MIFDLRFPERRERRGGVDCRLIYEGKEFKHKDTKGSSHGAFQVDEERSRDRLTSIPVRDETLIAAIYV